MTTTKSNYFVDLDGSLLKSDMLFESLAAVLSQNFLLIFLIPFWLLQGKTKLKSELALRAEIDVSTLPYNEQVLAFLHKEKENGRKLILATATHHIIANKIANHLQIFDGIIATDENNNLRGKLKLEQILSNCAGQKFSYIGNDSTDLPILKEAEEFILVDPSASVEQKAQSYEGSMQVFHSKEPIVKSIIKVIRPYQWVKNILIFVPLLTAQQWGNIDTIIQSFTAFIAFSICASGAYVLNDILDIKADRVHQTKRNRPFAMGSLSIPFGFFLAAFLPILGLSLCFMLPNAFLNILFIYYTITVIYSCWAKKIAMLDVIVISSLYTLRIIAGAAAIDVVLSFWLLAFSIFLFLSLALVKRCTELNNLFINGKQSAPGRGYEKVDIEYLRSLGTASGYLSVLVLALYIDNKDIVTLYSHPQLLWILCPALLYWIGYLWLMVARGKVHDDPIIFAFNDWPSRAVFAVVLTVVLLAI